MITQAPAYVLPSGELTLQPPPMSGNPPRDTAWQAANPGAGPGPFLQVVTADVDVDDESGVVVSITPHQE